MVISKFRDIKQSQSQLTNLGVHFNISAYAPFDKIAQFFYHFVLFGLLWDQTTGDMEHIPFDLHWKISLLVVYFFNKISLTL